VDEDRAATIDKKHNSNQHVLNIFGSIIRSLLSSTREQEMAESSRKEQLHNVFLCGAPYTAIIDHRSLDL
jgi:hypothetical protein